MCELVDNLLSEIDSVGYDFQNNHEFSMKRSSNFAIEFINKIGIKE